MRLYRRGVDMRACHPASTKSCPGNIGGVLTPRPGFHEGQAPPALALGSVRDHVRDARGAGVCCNAL